MVWRATPQRRFQAGRSDFSGVFGAGGELLQSFSPASARLSGGWERLSGDRVVSGTPGLAFIWHPL